MLPLHVKCCIAGGGPAGMMLGYLLARAGIDVVVLEKHADFFRDFRGDTVHPSTLEIIYELGLLPEFLKLPHEPVTRLFGRVVDEEISIANFAYLPVHAPYIAMMPQWDFLNFIAENGKRYPGFKLILQAEVTDLIEENGRITGLRAKTPQGELEIKASLVVGADGRHSIVREKAGLVVENLGAPIDVLWMRFSRKPTDTSNSFGRFDRGKIMAMINRGEYWQSAYVITKGQLETIKRQGLDALRASIIELIPFFRDRIEELRSWDDAKLLTVLVDRLKQWYRPGLLCIGDAAHAMSPIGGVGINLAVQDAVAAANILVQPLLENRLTTQDLKRVQERRWLATTAIQRFQVFAQNTIFKSALAEGGWKKVPWPLRLIQRFPFIQRIPARLLGLGVRPEHVQVGEKR